MRFTFVNTNIEHRYDVDTPYQSALPGSESAQCYLAVELARRGHDVRLLNGSILPKLARGVHCLPFFDGLPLLAESDVICVTNSAEFALELRDKVGNDMVVIAWEHNFWQQNPPSSNAALAKLTHRNDTILCVSDFHRNNYITEGHIDPRRVTVLRNAMSPAFEGIFSTSSSILDYKAWPSIFAFTSLPHKGLQLAVEWFSALRSKHPGITLNVFSSIEMYPANNSIRRAQNWSEITDKCAASPGINYIGSVSQPELSRSLRSTAIVFYPNISPETFSISVLEAMAAGCMVVTPDLGALSETLAGFGHIVPLRADGRFYREDFLSAATVELQRFAAADQGLAEHLRRQVAQVNRNATWTARAAEFELIAGAARS
jgi:glycosyltransferase involved in cell wall biosynthesis